MAYISGFKDNQLIGVDDLNAITSRLVTSGINNTLTNQGSISVTDLNGISAAIVTDGVVPANSDELRTSIDGGIVTILPGLAFFADGSFIEVTSEEKLEAPTGSFYVYVINDIAANLKEPRITNSMPSGDYVLLAFCDENGVMFDRRKYAMGRVPAYSSYAGYPALVEKTIALSGTRYSKTGSFTLDITGLPKNGIFFSSYNDLYGITGNYFGVYDFALNEYVTCINSSSSSKHTFLTDGLWTSYYTGSSGTRITFSMADENTLEVFVRTNTNSHEAEDSAHIKFIIF